MNRYEFKRFNVFRFEREKLFNEILKLLGNEQKVYIWFGAENPHIGGARPIDLLKIGREEKLIKFVENALSENEL